MGYLWLLARGKWAGEPGIKASLRHSIGLYKCMADHTLCGCSIRWTVLGKEEGKASEWVWCSNYYRTWQRLVWDPVVHAAYVSSWLSVRHRDREWRVTCYIRVCHRVHLTCHRKFSPSQSCGPAYGVKPGPSLHVRSLYQDIDLYWNFTVELWLSFQWNNDEKSQSIIPSKSVLIPLRFVSVYCLAVWLSEQIYFHKRTLTAVAIILQSIYMCIISLLEMVVGLFSLILCN